MSSDTTYNGWTNYATWRVNLEICDDLCSSLIGEQTFDSAYDLAAYLKETAEELVCGEDYHGEQLATQYAMAFLDDVNWDEIAESNADDLVTAEEEEEEESCPDCWGTGKWHERVAPSPADPFVHETIACPTCQSE